MYGTKLSEISEPEDTYGFVNEKEIRIATGIMMIFGIFSLFLVLFKGEFTIPLVLVSCMVLDFLMRIIISPKFSIFGGVVRPFLKNNTEYWVGSVQKRFAWSVGLVLSGFVLFCLMVLGGFLHMNDPTVQSLLNTIGTNKAQGTFIVTPMNPAIIACVLCIVFMWLESVVGYCVGCSIYKFLVRIGWFKEHKRQNCVNNTCAL